MMKNYILRLRTNTTMEPIEHLDEYKWEHPDSYGGHSPVGDYLVATLSRDCNTVRQSNYAVMKRIIKNAGGEVLTDYDETNPHTPYDFRAGHWACGWVEYIIVPRTADSKILEAVANALCALADYPVLDDGHHSELQRETAANYWQSMSIRNRIDAIKYNTSEETSIFAARHEHLPQCSDLTHYLADGC